MSFEAFFTPYECHGQLPGKRILVLAPHPDDEVFGCGGALANAVKAGAEVQVAIVTDGVLQTEGGHLPEVDALKHRQALAAQRKQESTAAAAVLGYPAPIFLGGQDGDLLSDESMASKIRELCLSWRPDLVLAPSVWEMHRDHRATAVIALNTFKGDSAGWNAQNQAQLMFYEVGVPLVPNYFIDITQVQASKAKAVACFKSQLGLQRYADQIDGLNRFRSYTLGADVTVAEAFHCVAPDQIHAFEHNHKPAYVNTVLLQAERQLILVEHALGLERESRAIVEAELENVYASRSWRLTEYLRKIKRFMVR